MKTKTIKKLLTNKLNEWIATIDGVGLQEDVRNNLLVSGGSIASMLLRTDVNDYDIYIQDMDVLKRLANYYCRGEVLDGREREELLADRFPDIEDGRHVGENAGIDDITHDGLYVAEPYVRIANLNPNQIKLDIQSVGKKFEVLPQNKEGNNVYLPVFLSQNAISLTNDIQIVLRFNGTPEEIHKTFDFIHATNYFTFKDGLVLNLDAMTSLMTRDLRYQGSMYPLTSIIRMKKFIGRGWNIGAGEILKIMFQISLLDLQDIKVLEDQLIGVDVAYFGLLIDALRVTPKTEITVNHINELIDKIFNEYNEELDKT